MSYNLQPESSMKISPFDTTDDNSTKHGFRNGSVTTRTDRKQWLEKYLEFIIAKKVSLKKEMAENEKLMLKLYKEDDYWAIEEVNNGIFWETDDLSDTEEIIKKLLANM